MKARALNANVLDPSQYSSIRRAEAIGRCPQVLTWTCDCRHPASANFGSPAGLNPNAGSFQPPPILIYPHSPVSPYRIPAGAAFAGWHWPSQLPPPSPQPTRSVVTIARAGACLAESRLRHVIGNNGSVRAITSLDPHGSCSVVSFFDVRSAVTFFDAMTKVRQPTRHASCVSTDSTCVSHAIPCCRPCRRQLLDQVLAGSSRCDPAHYHGRRYARL